MTASQDCILYATVIWMPSFSEFQELKKLTNGSPGIEDKFVIQKCRSLVSLRKHLSRTLGDIPVRFSNISIKKGFSFEYEGCTDDDPCIVNKTSNTLCYSEALCAIECELHTERSLTYCFDKITNLFCSRQKGSKISSEMWMIFDMSCLVADHHIKSASEYVKFQNFSLGNIVGLNSFVSHFASSSSLKAHGYKITQVEGRFLHDLQTLDLYFVVGNNNVPVSKRSHETHKLFKLTLGYNSIHKILICCDENFSVYFHYLQPPLLYATLYDESNLDHTEYVSLTYLSPDTQWERVVDIFQGSPCELRKEFSMNTVLKLEFRNVDYDPLIQLKEHCKNFEIYFSPMQNVSANKNLQINAFNVDNFDCFYALKCLLTRSFEVLDHIAVHNDVKEVRNSLKIKCNENPALLVDVLIHIYNSIDQGNVILFNNAVEVLYESLDTSFSSFKLNSIGNSNTGQRNKEVIENAKFKSEIIYIRRAIVTPTHTRFLPHHPTLKSRLLRRCDPNFALRISVRDINLKGLNFTVKTGRNKKQIDSQKKFFDDHVVSQLLKGIKIGDRHYKYLGGSTSQLRSHGLWFYAIDKENRTSEMIRKNIGYLDEIYLVPKFMARMGQSFSQAMGCIKVPQSNTNVNCPEPDILGTEKVYASESDDDTDGDAEDYKRILNDFSVDNDAIKVLSDSDRYNFSDGIGRISEKIAKQVYQKLELEDEEPSAFQIRYAGCKGMLAIDPRIEGEKIYFRKSMRKFPSDDDSLEIIKTSEPRVLYLNRPFITILEQMGIDKEVFIDLQKQTIKQLIGSIFYDFAAEQLLRTNNHLHIDYANLYKSGISFTEDPFFRSIILAIFKREILLLKNKARILIPEDKGRTMFGVLDETSSLNYGEVFVQYTSLYGDDKKKGIIVEGTVVVTKNPCMHPGDVRKFQAVDKESLRHIRDCIVFPAKGPRPHPDEMAGSDLDGDEYSIVWYPDLIFERENWAAMCYSFKTKEKIQEDQERPVTVEDQMQFFCNFILNESVGLLANAHLAYADQHRNGIFSRKCLSIAKHYSKALDFAKTGRPARVAKKHRTFLYPDFMQKLGEKNSYLSTRTLGYLYRNCKQFEMGLEATTHDNEFSIDSDLVYENWKDYEGSALKALSQYSSKVKSSVKAYGIDNEGELISGALAKVSKIYEDRHDYADLVNILEYEVRKLFQNLQKEFFKEFGGKPPNNNFSESMFKKASAWYNVTYRQEGEQNYYGLPWAVSDVLIEIKKRKTKIVSKQEGMMPASILTKKSCFMEKVIDKCLENSFSNKAKIFPQKKLAILETAFETLSGWLKLQEKNLLFIKLEELESCLYKVFDNVSSELTSCEDRYIENLLKNGNDCKLMSPAYYILESLMHIVELGTTPNVKENYFDLYQEFGLFAWVTLVKLGCSRNTQALGILSSTDEAEGVTGLYVTNEDEIDTIKLPITGQCSQEKFSEKIVHHEESVISFLKSLTNLKYIHMRMHEDKNKNYSLRITVKGSHLSVDRFKSLVVAPMFMESVIKEKHPSALREKSDKTFCFRKPMRSQKTGKM